MKYPVCALGLALLVSCGDGNSAELGQIGVMELWQRINEDSALFLLDVRSPAEYENIHAKPVKRLIEHTRVADVSSHLTVDKNTPIYLICRTGRRSGIAGQDLVDLGFTQVYNVTGGTNAWRDAGLPTETGPGVLRDNP